MTYGMLKFSLMKEDTLLKETLCFSSYITTARLMTLENMKMNCLREARAYAEKHGYCLTIINKETFRRNHYKFKDGVFLNIARDERTQLCPRQQLHCLAPVFYYLSR